jgi:hypothetical protein
LIVDLLWADPRGKTGALVEMWAEPVGWKFCGKSMGNSSIFQFHRGNINGKYMRKITNFVVIAGSSGYK